MITTPAQKKLIILPKLDGEKLFINKTVIKNELKETSICQRIKTINDYLFDEYRSELLTFRQEIGARGNTHDIRESSSRHYDSQSSDY